MWSYKNSKNRAESESRCDRTLKEDSENESQNETQEGERMRSLHGCCSGGKRSNRVADGGDGGSGKTKMKFRLEREMVLK